MVTSMTRAIEGGSVDGVNYLLAKGVGVNSVVRDSSMRRCEKSYLLHFASCAGNNAIVKTLIAHGANVKQINRYNDTAMRAAAEKGSFDNVKTLLEAGADVNDGTLSVAAKILHVDMVELLLEHDAASSYAFEKAMNSNEQRARPGIMSG